MRKERMKRKDDKYPSSNRGKINISIEKSMLIRVIILILTLFLILGCTINYDTPRKKVFCYDGYHSSSGWVSAESSYKYWVVGENGKVIEYSKSKCSTRG